MAFGSLNGTGVDSGRLEGLVAGVPSLGAVGTSARFVPPILRATAACAARFCRPFMILSVEANRDARQAD